MATPGTLETRSAAASEAGRIRTEDSLHRWWTLKRQGHGRRILKLGDWMGVPGPSGSTYVFATWKQLRRGGMNP